MNFIENSSLFSSKKLVSVNFTLTSHYFNGFCQKITTYLFQNENCCGKAYQAAVKKTKSSINGDRFPQERKYSLEDIIND